MTLRGSGVRYGPVAQAFHWLTAVLVLVAFVESVGGPEARVYSAARAGQLKVHETLGMGLFAVVLLRVLWRLADPPPRTHPGPAWLVKAADAVQRSLYVLLAVIPVTAIAGAWLEGHPLELVGLVIAPRMPLAHLWGERISEAHVWSGDAMMWIAGAHTAAALLHHYRYRDHVLGSMLPTRLGAILEP